MHMCLTLCHERYRGKRVAPREKGFCRQKPNPVNDNTMAVTASMTCVLDTLVTPAKMDKPIKMPFYKQTLLTQGTMY